VCLRTHEWHETLLYGAPLGDGGGGGGRVGDTLSARRRGTIRHGRVRLVEDVLAPVGQSRVVLQFGTAFCAFSDSGFQTFGVLVAHSPMVSGSFFGFHV